MSGENGATLSGPGFDLRPLRAADAAALYALRAIPEVVRYTGVPLYTGIAQAREYIVRVMRECAQGTAVFWALVPAGRQEMAGGVCLWNPSPDRRVWDIGYELSPACQGHGLMGTAVQLVARYAFEEMGLRRILADPHAGNTASIALLERCGFTPCPDAPRAGHLLFALENPGAPKAP